VKQGYLVFTGRPNAGKSSTIKKITGIKAEAGKRPGTTSKITLYPLSKDLILVDMPGYGRISKAGKKRENLVKDQILEFIEENSDTILVSVHVLDISTFSEISKRLDRKGFIPIDIEMIQLLTDTIGTPPLIAINKIDKINQRELKSSVEDLKNRLFKTNPEAMEYIHIISAKTGQGTGSLKDAIHNQLTSKGFRTPFKQERS